MAETLPFRGARERPNELAVYEHRGFGSSFVSLPKPPKTTPITQEVKSKHPTQQTTDLQEFS
jgi:hypothetical protein